MHILYFHQHFCTPLGAGGVRSYHIAQKLIERGHSVTMICGSYGLGDTGIEGPFSSGRREGMVNGISVIEFDLAYSNKDSFRKRAWSFVQFAAKSVSLALRSEYDVLFATSTPLTASIPGIFAKLLRRKPFVFEVRDLWPELPREMGVIKSKAVLFAMDILEWLSYRTADLCIALSPGIQEGIRRRRNSVPIKMIPNGSDLEAFAVDPRDSWRPAGVSTDDFVAVFAGTHGIANGLDAVLSCAVELKRQQQEKIKLVMIGDGKLKPSLIKRAELENLDNCIFLDPVNKKQLASLLAGSDAGLMILANVEAFYFGTSPNKFFDYLAAGLPVVNNYPGWIAGMIVENRCGIAVPPENPKAFAEALVTLKDNPGTTDSMRAESRNLAERSFDWSELATQLATSLEQHFDSKQVLRSFDG